MLHYHSTLLLSLLLLAPAKLVGSVPAQTKATSNATQETNPAILAWRAQWYPHTSPEITRPTHNSKQARITNMQELIKENDRMIAQNELKLIFMHAQMKKHKDMLRERLIEKQVELAQIQALNHAEHYNQQLFLQRENVQRETEAAQHAQFIDSCQQSQREQEELRERFRAILHKDKEQLHLEG